MSLLKTLQQLYTHVHSSAVYNSHGGEINSSDHQRMNEQSWAVHTVEYYSAVTRKKILTHVQHRRTSDTSVTK